MTQAKISARGRSSVIVAAVLVALCFGLIRTSGAAAAPANHECGAQSGGSVTNAANTTGDFANGFSIEVQPGQPGSQAIVVGGCATGVEKTAPSFTVGTTCAFTLPEGVVPGSTIVVSQSSELPGCVLQIVEPGASTFQIEPANAVGGTSGVEFCSTELPGDVTVTLEPRMESGGTASLDEGSFSVAAIPGVEAGTIEIVPANGAVTGVTACGCGAANGGGANSEGTFAVVPATDDAGCIVVIEGSAGGAQPGETATDSPDAVAPGEAGASSDCAVTVSPGLDQPDAGASAGGNPTWT